jgi:[NiFe] hydrogenase assembly HybE family chaperone
MEGPQAVAERLARIFETIHRERMLGLPVLNPNLRVQVAGAQNWAGGWLGVLITPWCKNMLALPAHAADLGPTGSKRNRTFPSGDYEFIAGDPAEIGHHEACSLFSPLHEFADQDAAVATAHEVLRVLMEPTAAAASATSAPAGPLDRKLSRRGLCRALSGNGPRAERDAAP